MSGREAGRTSRQRPRAAGPGKRLRQNAPRRLPRWRLAGTFLAAFFMILLGGCAGGGQMNLASVLDPDLSLVGDFDHGVYSLADENTLRIVLVAGELDDPQQVVQIRMHWRPRAGRTPLDRTSTNASVRYVIFTEEGAGLYSGAGFLFPRSRPGRASFRGQVRHSSVRLVDATEDFVDRLGLAEVRGAFNVRRDDAAALRLTRLVERRLTERLEYPLVVEGDAGDRDVLVRRD